MTFRYISYPGSAINLLMPPSANLTRTDAGYRVERYTSDGHLVLADWFFPLTREGLLDAIGHAELHANLLRVPLESTMTPYQAKLLHREMK